MDTSLLSSKAETLNAKAASVGLGVAAFMTLLLSHTSASLAPLRLLTLAVAAFAVWAFCDEMGIRKPLNRAGFVFFAIASSAKVQIALGLTEQFIGRYYLLYSAFLLVAVLLWSVAFLHRKGDLKIIGVVGAAASIVPVVALVGGHLVVGFGAAIGVEAMLSAAAGATSENLSFVTLVERIFGLWGYVAAWLLWRGHIKAQS